METHNSVISIRNLFDNSRGTVCTDSGGDFSQVERILQSKLFHPLGQSLLSLETTGQ